MTVIVFTLGFVAALTLRLALDTFTYLVARHRRNQWSEYTPERPR
jgi:hypothetical protein